MNRLQTLYPSFSIILMAGLVVSVAPGHAQVVARAQQTAPELIEALGADDAMTRAAAACELGERSAATAIPALIKLLADDASIAPFTCSESWGRTAFNSPGREAANALIHIGLEAAEAVLRVLDHSLGSIREKAVWILGALDYRPAVGKILDMVTEDDYFLTRANAAWALGAMDVSEATPSLGNAVRKDEHERVREQAAWALGALDAEDGVDELIRALLDDTSPEVRSQAAWALGAIGDSRAVVGLIRALGDDHTDVRSQAAWALGAIGDPRAAEGLTAALKDVSADVRQQAVWALGALD